MIHKRKKLTLRSTVCRNDMYNGSQEEKKRGPTIRRSVLERKGGKKFYTRLNQEPCRTGTQENQLFLRDRKYSGFLLCFGCFTNIHFPLFIAP